MQTHHKVYLAYTGIFLIITLGIVAIPLLSFSMDMGPWYEAISAAHICHQKLSRSLCIFDSPGGYVIWDCIPQSGNFVNDAPGVFKVVENGVVGYEMPVCARDFALYGAMAFGALAYPFVRDLKERSLLHYSFLILAIIPLGLDGTIQLVSETGLLPFIYESSNAMRLLTGALAGFASSFYAIPLLMNLFAQPEWKKPEHETPKQEGQNPESERKRSKRKPEIEN